MHIIRARLDAKVRELLAHPSDTLQGLGKFVLVLSAFLSIHMSSYWPVVIGGVLDMVAWVGAQYLEPATCPAIVSTNETQNMEQDETEQPITGSMVRVPNAMPARVARRGTSLYGGQLRKVEFEPTDYATHAINSTVFFKDRRAELPNRKNPMDRTMLEMEGTAMLHKLAQRGTDATVGEAFLLKDRSLSKHFKDLAPAGMESLYRDTNEAVLEHTFTPTSRSDIETIQRIREQRERGSHPVDLNRGIYNNTHSDAMDQLATAIGERKTKWDEEHDAFFTLKSRVPHVGRQDDIAGRFGQLAKIARGRRAFRKP